MALVMKAAWICLIIFAVAAIIGLGIMVTLATGIKVEDEKSMDIPMSFRFAKNLGIITWTDKNHHLMAVRYPYVAAITVNSSHTWSFACFASVILVKWVLTSAHCRRPKSMHRVLLYYDFSKNYTYTYPILFWKVHENFHPKNRISFDIAIAKLNIDLLGSGNPSLHLMKSSLISDLSIYNERNNTLEASVWKTVATMDNKLFLTNDFESFHPKIVDSARCVKTLGVNMNESLFCVDMSDYDDCFVHEFGPIYKGDRLIGIITVNPRDCNIKLAVFTNVTYYANWVLNATRAHFY